MVKPNLRSAFAWTAHFRDVGSFFSVKIFRISLLALTFLAVAAQLIQTPRNESARVETADIFAVQPAPDAIRTTIREACYDCHSNQTRYPWYASVQPFAWWLGRHIDEGKDHLNFSEFGHYSTDRMSRKLEQSYEEIDGDTMPLTSYKWLHPSGRLTKEQKKAVLDWLDSLENKIAPEKNEN